MEIELICVDLDGTALDADKRLGEKTLWALRACRDRGMRVAVATARSEAAALPYTRAIQPDAVISCGGALARVGEEIVYRRALPAATADALVLALAQSPDVRYVTLETDSGYFVNYPPGSYPDWAGIPVDFTRPRGEDALKIMANLRHPRAAAWIREAFPQCAVTFYAGEPWCSMAHLQAEKGLALAAALSRVGVPPVRALAFGDDENDLGMLRLCGVSVAMENALDSVKAQARCRCPSHREDGVGAWILENILRQRNESK